MHFYAIANKECVNCFYDFELNTWGDGICTRNLLPSEDFAIVTLFQYELEEDGIVIEVFIHKITEGDDGIIDYEFEDIWHEK